ncbi:SCO family protein [Bacillus sp. CGMCC 1.16607]|uniref:SCO family protein n=1 Tax=Bacillus sp. CGMCC 1.16607 TaxID=3351842 RepID=UPI003642303F
MKKVYIISSILILFGITAGISVFLIRDNNAHIPKDVILLNQNGEEYRFGDDHKNVKLVEFIYTNCPDICPTTTQKMNQLKADLIDEGVFGKKVEFITITIDPYRDTPDVLKKYMNTFEIENDGSWLFLTGDSKNIKQAHENTRKVSDALQFQYRDPGDGYFVHSSFTFLVDEENKFIKKFPMGTEFNKKEVFDEIMENID